MPVTVTCCHCSDKIPVDQKWGRSSECGSRVQSAQKKLRSGRIRKGVPRSASISLFHRNETLPPFIPRFRWHAGFATFTFLSGSVAGGGPQFFFHKKGQDLPNALTLF